MARPFVDLRKRKGAKSPRPKSKKEPGRHLCQHCHSWLPLDFFDINKQHGRPMSLCKRCRAKRKLTPARESQANTIKRTRALMESLKVCNTCAHCGDTRGPFRFFRREPKKFGILYKMSEAKRAGPAALMRAIAVNDALCPACTLKEMRKRSSQLRNKGTWREAPRSFKPKAEPPKYLSVFFPTVDLPKKELALACGMTKLPRTMLDMRRYGDRLKKGHQTFQARVHSFLIKAYKECPTKTDSAISPTSSSSGFSPQGPKPGSAT